MNPLSDVTYYFQLKPLFDLLNIEVSVSKEREIQDKLNKHKLECRFGCVLENQYTFHIDYNPIVIQYYDAYGALKYITSKRFKDVFNCEWIDNIKLQSTGQFIDITQLDYSSTTSDNQQLANQVKSKLRNPNHDAFYIKYINDEVGYGLVKSWNSIIKKDDILFIYTGVYEDNKQTIHDNDHALGDMDAETYGNFGRFMLHLPDSISFYSQAKYEQASTIKHPILINNTIAIDTVATANVTTRELIVPLINHRIKIIVIVASRDILANEFIGFNYGSEYWTSRIESTPCGPSLLYKQSTKPVISHQDYDGRVNYIYSPPFTLTNRKKRKFVPKGFM